MKTLLILLLTTFTFLTTDASISVEIPNLTKMRLTRTEVNSKDTEPKDGPVLNKGEKKSSTQNQKTDVSSTQKTSGLQETTEYIISSLLGAVGFLLLVWIFGRNGKKSTS